MLSFSAVLLHLTDPVSQAHARTLLLMIQSGQGKLQRVQQRMAGGSLLFFHSIIIFHVSHLCLFTLKCTATFESNSNAEAADFVSFPQFRSHDSACKCVFKDNEHMCVGVVLIPCIKSSLRRR